MFKNNLGNMFCLKNCSKWSNSQISFDTGLNCYTGYYYDTNDKKKTNDE